MAITKLSNSGIKTGVLKYDSMLAGNAPYDPAATWLIARQTLSTTATSVTFSSIPSTYQHLQLRVMGRTSGSTSVTIDYGLLRINGDTGSNYAYHQLYGNGASVFASGAATQTFAGDLKVAGASAGTSTMGVFILDLHDYKSTSKTKTIRTFNGVDNNGSGEIYLWSGLWNSTSAVTSISLTCRSGNSFVSGSTFALYGFKG